MACRVLYKLINYIFVLALFLACVQGEFNVCSTNSGLACVSSNQFQVCVNGTPAGNINSCPSETVCSSAGNRICQEIGSNAIEARQDCKRCDATNTFACTGPSTYVLCLGTITPSQSEGSCQTSHVCNRNNRFICEDSTTGGVATCSEAEISTQSPTTTPSLHLDPEGFCNAKQEYKRFPLGLEADPTCRVYIHCFMTFGGVWRSRSYTCPEGTYFNISIDLCDSEKPPGCL